MAGHSDRPIAVYGALVANFLIAVTKFTAAAFTGSSAMFSEGIHSVVDTGNQALLLLGIRRAGRPADTGHPFGHGKELYFWSLIVAMLLFSLGGGLAIYEGITHLRHPEPVADPTWNYVVLGVAFVFESIAWWMAYRQLRAEFETGSLLHAVRHSKDPAVYTVIAEDTAATLGLVIAFLGILIGHALENPVWDAVASLLIGVMLAGVAVFLAIESRGLLVGESASPETVASVRRIVESDPAVSRSAAPLTMHLGPRQILLNLDLEFRGGISSGEVTAAVDRLEAAIRREHPEVKRIFIEAEALRRAG